MKRTGSLEEILGAVWDLYIGKGASNYSTRRYLTNLGIFSETEIFRLMERLQVTLRSEAKENEE